MMCKPTNCCCAPFMRRFKTQKEELESLEEYQDQLKKELEAVTEHIKNRNKK